MRHPYTLRPGLVSQTRLFALSGPSTPIQHNCTTGALLQNLLEVHIYVQCMRPGPHNYQHRTIRPVRVSLWKAYSSYLHHPHHLRPRHALNYSVAVGRVRIHHLLVHLRIPQGDNCARSSAALFAILVYLAREHPADLYPACSVRTSNISTRAGACKGCMTRSPEDWRRTGQQLLYETDRVYLP